LAKKKATNAGDLAPVTQRLLTIHAAAQYLSAHVWAIRKLAWDGLVPTIKIGNRLLFDRADLNKYVDALKRTA
jgi:excisionase family DNA binding protein